MNDRLHPLLQQQISRHLPSDYLKQPDLNRFLEEVNKSCYSPLATPAPATAAAEAEAVFLSIANHETRTPLNGIVGVLDLMQQEPIPPAWQDHFQTLRVSVNAIQLAISNILDYRSITVGQLNLHMVPHPIRQLLDTLLVVNQHKVQGTDVSITLSVDDAVPADVQCDPVRLNQILNNVLMNAITFVRNGVISIRVGMQHSPADESSITFSVDIPSEDPDQYAMLTSPAMRGESMLAQPANGLGLAMFVSQRLLNLCGSSIQVDRPAGRGLVLSFAIPTFAVQRPHLTHIQPNPQTLSGMRVLMVEDYPINVRIASRFLERWQVVVEVAENGQIALDKYRTGHFDLILMDMQMPVMDGLSATRAIRQLDDQIPIVALTASATPTDQANAYAAGMNSFITKPFNSDELFQTLLRFSRRAA
ncbi:response regulator [Spirosoma rhododendri]|uniref:histidine kinase n=1 Tax=Spirosoma rhododendri TaxID=2728024 RepID=A0A7L5DLY9_9BACT|nr:response regulator [Spirosoma rhododendri]QJD79436.1 response regulator [Spirosoma rhododendri]